jgi:hypothetical protein
MRTDFETAASLAAARPEQEWRAAAAIGVRARDTVTAEQLRDRRE